jgi:hypothetical protein
LQELCHSEEFVCASYKVVLAELNCFFDSASHGGDIVFRHTSAVLDDTRSLTHTDNAGTVGGAGPGLNKSSSRNSLFSPEGGMDSGQLIVNDAGAAVVAKGSSYPDIFSPQGPTTTGDEYATKKRHFFHRMLFPLLAPAQNTLALPISIEYLTAHLPCKVALMSILGTVEGGFIPECRSNGSKTRDQNTATAEDESLHQLCKDFSRDRLVVQGVKISGAHISLDELIELAVIQARQCIYNTAVTNSADAEVRQQYIRQIGMVNTDSVDRESSVYEPNEFFGDGSAEVEAGMLGVDAYVYSARSSSVGSDGGGGMAQRRSPPRSSPPSRAVAARANGSSAPFANSVPRLPGVLPETRSSPPPCPFIDLQNQAAISSTCANAGIFDEMLRAFVLRVLFTASRTNSAYHANIALQIMLGILQLPSADGEMSVRPSVGSDGEDAEDPGELIISPDSALARPIYIEFTWKQLPMPVDGDVSYGFGIYGGDSALHSPVGGELVWCLVCDIKCATVYKLVNSNDIEKVLLQCKTTYYQQVVLTANPRSPLNYTESGDNINTGAWLFLDRDVKLTGEHTLVWKSDV